MSDETLIRVLKWVGGNDTGMSSKAIANHMSIGQSDGCYPLDPADLGRCLRLLRQFPEWKPRLPEMAVYGDVWARYVARWDDMAKSMEDEVGVDWEKSRRAPITYALMHDISHPEKVSA